MLFGGMARKLPGTFVHFRCTPQLTEALDAVADEYGISRSEATRVILELYLFDDVRLIAAKEGLGQVRQAVHVAQSAGYEAFKVAFAQALEGVADPGGRPRPGALALRGASSYESSRRPSRRALDDADHE